MAPLVPVATAAWWLTIFTSMFMHGGILHIVGNMLFLWVFGNNIEDSMGRLPLPAFYLLAGMVAVFAQAALETELDVTHDRRERSGLRGAWAATYCCTRARECSRW